MRYLPCLLLCALIFCGCDTGRTNTKPRTSPSLDLDYETVWNLSRDILTNHTVFQYSMEKLDPVKGEMETNWRYTTGSEYSRTHQRSKVTIKLLNPETEQGPVRVEIMARQEVNVNMFEPLDPTKARWRHEDEYGWEPLMQEQFLHLLESRCKTVKRHRDLGMADPVFSDIKIRD